MAEVLGLGLTHYPSLLKPDAIMSGLLRRTLDDPDLPPSLREPGAWPPEMQAEWEADQRGEAAVTHRTRVWSGVDRLRTRLDEFEPDVVLIWGDDQYENFREDVIPPFCVLSYDSIVAQPWKGAPTPNYWDEPEDKTFHLSGAREVGNYLTEHLLEAEFDVSYAYQPLHHASLPHAFLNAVLMLDRERTGFPYPLLPFAMNCYGRRVISYKGRPSKLAEKYPFDPPSPSPRRFFDLGAAIGRILHESPWRVALVASSSWSHAFLVDKHHRLYPDVAADRRLYGFLTGGELSAWRDLTLTAIEDSGQQEFLNWVCLGGAMSALGATLAWSDFVESHIFNSNKVLALFDVVE